MKKQDKIYTVENLAKTLKSAQTIVLTNYKGLNVSQMTKLRSLVKKAGGKFLVIKNTLLKKALEKASLPLPEGLTGPTALLIGLENDTQPIKAVFNFSKEEGLPVFKSGLFQNKAIKKEEVEKLGMLPGKEELLAKLLGLIKAPSYRLAFCLSSNQQKLVYILDQKAQSKEKTEGGE